MSDARHDAVRQQYGALAARSLSAELEGARAVAAAFGYSEEQLQAVPEGANLGVSCGNPTAFASLQPGEVVVDLGCGGGLDVFLAARRVGPEGRAIGIDMTEEMLTLARRNAERGPDGRPYENVEFYQATIDHLPLPDATVDCVISNCVINLAPDKPAVFREIFRVLKPGGRVAVSDIALKQDLPEELAGSIMAYVGCIAGAIKIADYETGLRAAGFDPVQIIDSKADLNAYAKMENQTGCCSPAMSEPASTNSSSTSRGTSLTIAATPCCGGEPTGSSKDLHSELADLLKRYDINLYAASVQVYAIKP